MANNSKASVACQEVDTRDGIKAAKFLGKIAKKTNDLTVVNILNVARTPISQLGFNVGAGGMITMDLKEVTVDALLKGDSLTFWVQEGRYGVWSTMSVKPLRIVKPASMQGRTVTSGGGRASPEAVRLY